MTNDSGLVVTSHEYLPFGEDWITEGDTKNAPKYNSQEWDKESGYYFYNARHYDPEIARFVTPDSIIDGENSTQGWNRYAYCHNNPIIYKDPTGHDAQSRSDSASGYLTGLVSGLADYAASLTPHGMAAKGIEKGVELATGKKVDILPKFKLEKEASSAKRNGFEGGRKTIDFLETGASIIGAVVGGATGNAPKAITDMGKKLGVDVSFGASQGLLTYGATTPVDKQTLKGAAISTVVGAATGVVSNITGKTFFDKAPAVVKALNSAGISAAGNYVGQRVSGKDTKDVSWASVGWSAATSGSASYLGSKTNLSETGQSLVGKGAMIVPRISGAAMINMAEKQLKKE